METADVINKFETSGSNQSVMRIRNERLVLTILRRMGPMSKAEIARKTGLSAQTVSVIMRALERDGLLEKGEKQRGKIGQPSVPMRLAPGGAYFLGLKVGRRSAELILVNFIGEELAQITETYNYPSPKKTLEFARSAVVEISQVLPSDKRDRISGMGIASPYFLWEWANVIGVAPDAMAAWKGFDLQTEVSKLFDFPVFLGNDATSACGAELTFGTTETPPDFLYLYIGYFIGGGVVLNGALYPGRAGNAGAIGPFPVVSHGAKTTQLVDTASLIGLERRLSKHFDDPTIAVSPDIEWQIETPDIVEQWLADAVPALAQSIAGACSFIDFSSVLIDGNMPAAMRSLVVERVSKKLNELPTSGLIKPAVVAGSLGSKARPLGAASLALSKKFMLDS